MGRERKAWITDSDFNFYQMCRYCRQFIRKKSALSWGRILESLNIDDIRKCGSQLLEAKKWGPSFSGTNPYLHVGLKMED
jgi:hypothetical protein